MIRTLNKAEPTYRVDSGSAFEGEKNPGRGVKENLKPCAYKLWERDQSVTAYFL